MVGLNEESRNFIINPIENLSHTLILERDQVYPHCLPDLIGDPSNPLSTITHGLLNLKTIATW